MINFIRSRLLLWKQHCRQRSETGTHRHHEQAHIRTLSTCPVALACDVPEARVQIVLGPTHKLLSYRNEGYHHQLYTRIKIKTWFLCHLR